MIGFKTRNSIYEVDTVNQTITGGKLGLVIYPYIQLKVFEGARAQVRLANGKIMTTGIVEKIF